jgi:hypothetical protein
MMTNEVQQAIAELKAAHGDDAVVSTPDGEGGAYVIVNNVGMGDKYTPAKCWCGFRITYMYPESEVYPHFFHPDLKRVDGNPFGSGFSINTQWNGLNTVQVSRRSNHWNAALDTAKIKIDKVIKWMKEQ